MGEWLRWLLPRRGVRVRPVAGVPSTPADTPAQPAVDPHLAEPHLEPGHGGVVLLAVAVVAAGFAFRAWRRSRQ
jgi:hypothetical protein